MYAQLTAEEIQTLSTKKASGCAWATYTALAAHTWKKATCFPSITRIWEVLGGAYTERAIYKALKFLERAGLITRKKATMKERFGLVLKTAKKVLKHGSRKRKNNRSKLRTTVPHKRKDTFGNRTFSNLETNEKSSADEFNEAFNGHSEDVVQFIMKCFQQRPNGKNKPDLNVSRQTVENCLKDPSAGLMDWRQYVVQHYPEFALEPSL